MNADEAMNVPQSVSFTEAVLLFDAIRYQP